MRIRPGDAGRSSGAADRRAHRTCSSARSYREAEGGREPMIDWLWSGMFYTGLLSGIGCGVEVVRPVVVAARHSDERVVLLGLGCGVVAVVWAASSLPESRTTEASSSRLDAFAPVFHFRERHEIIVAAPQDVAFAAVARQQQMRSRCSRHSPDKAAREGTGEHPARARGRALARCRGAHDIPPARRCGAARSAGRDGGPGPGGISPRRDLHARRTVSCLAAASSWPR